MIQLGYFGKTIHRGDFVRFNLPKAFITVMDDWLQSVMINGESVHTSDWPQRYMQCPGYSFHLSPNIAGDNRWSGVIGASKDKVGRRFPFCIAAGLPNSYPPSWTQSELNEGISELTSMLIQVQALDYDFDNLQEELEVLSQSLTTSLSTIEMSQFQKQDLPDADQFSLMTTGAHPGVDSTATASVLDVVLRQAYFNHSIWSPLDANPAFRGLVTSGLPDEKAALALFDNAWESVAAGMLESPVKDSPPQDVPETNAAVLTTVGAVVIDDAIDDVDNGDDELPDKKAWNALEEADPAVNESQLDSPAVDDSESPTTPQPRIEPLELEEDSSTEAPWD